MLHPERDRIATILGLLPVAVVFSVRSIRWFLAHSVRKEQHARHADGHRDFSPAYQSLQAALVLGMTQFDSDLPTLAMFHTKQTAHRNGTLFALLFRHVGCVDGGVVLEQSRSRQSPLAHQQLHLISIAELCVSPLGFSPRQQARSTEVRGTLMGLWMAAIALGNLATGLLGILWERWTSRCVLFPAHLDSLRARFPPVDTAPATRIAYWGGQR